MFSQKKKGYFIAFVFAIILSTTAHTQVTIKNFSGPYVGISLGYSTSNSQLDRESLVTSRQSSLKMSGQAQQFSGLLGYGTYLKSPLYIGVEGRFSYTNYKGKFTYDNSDSRTFTYEIRNSYALAGRLGYNVQDVALVYVKAGIVYSETRLQALEHVDSQGGVTWQKYLKASEIGLGVDFAISENLTVGAEVSQTRYQSASINVNDLVNYKIQPQINTFALRTTWRF